jgi:NAD(P)-dependent dehydrogenase (short-subunit alcohol dehydrogenase family)
MSDTNRVAVITGASPGVGEVIARELVAEGDRVPLLGRRIERIAALADGLGNGTIAIQADVTDRASIVAAAERVQQELGGAEILINNAASFYAGYFEELTPEQMDRQLATSLLGP